MYTGTEQEGTKRNSQEKEARESRVGKLRGGGQAPGREAVRPLPAGFLVVIRCHMHRSWECGVGPQNWGTERPGTGRLLAGVCQCELSAELVTLTSLGIFFVKY